MIRTILAVFVISVSSVAFAADVEQKLTCQGSHSETGAPVYGECNGGEFVGYFAQTGKPVYGKCDLKGGFTAYDPETGKRVLLKCKPKN